MRRATSAIRTLVASWRGASPPVQTDPEPPPTVRLPPADAPTAVRRMAQRFPHLLPVSSDVASFAAWADRHGVPDSDPDAYMALYADVCELAGWDVLPAEPSRTIDSVDVPHALLPALSSAEAARRFADWVIASDRCGDYRSEALTALYLEHAAAIGHEPSPQNTLRQHLAAIPGVKRGLQETVDLRAKGNRKDRRLRSQAWHLYPESAETELPFDLPARHEVAFRLAA